MRPITHLITCYWTSNERGFGKQQIDAQFRKSGYMSLPYHFVVRRDGTIEVGRSIERAGKIDHRLAAASINVCVVLPSDDTGTGEKVKYTDVQRDACQVLIQQIQKKYEGIELEVLGPVRGAK